MTVRIRMRHETAYHLLAIGPFSNDLQFGDIVGRVGFQLGDNGRAVDGVEVGVERHLLHCGPEISPLPRPSSRTGTFRDALKRKAPSATEIAPLLLRVDLAF